MRCFKHIIFSIVVFAFFICNANAEQVDAEVKIKGANVSSGKLTLELECKNDSGFCTFTEVHWFYNDVNSTSGGTEILHDYNDPENEGRQLTNTNYMYLSRKYYDFIGDHTDHILAGKYIYVTGKISNYGSYNPLDPITFAVITNAEDNTFATLKDDNIEVNSSTGFNVEPIIENKGTTNAHLKLKVNGLPQGYSDDGDVAYDAFVSDTEMEHLSPGGVCGSGHGDSILSGGAIKGFAIIKDGYIQLEDDAFLSSFRQPITHVYFTKHTKYTNGDNVGYTCETYLQGTTFEMPDIPKLGSRYSISRNLISDKLSIKPNFPYSGGYGPHQIKMVVGKLDSSEILEKILSKKSGAYEDLLQYAKDNNSTNIYEFKDDELDNIKFDNLKVDSGSFYYINLKYSWQYYRDTEDVILAVAINDKLYGLGALDPDSDDFLSLGYGDVASEQELKDEEEKENKSNLDKELVEDKSTSDVLEEKKFESKETEENPKTGVFVSTIAISTLLVTGTIWLSISKKKSKVFISK